MPMRFLLVLPALLFAVACGHAPPLTTQQRGDVADGRQLAEVNCSACHAIGASGESLHPMAPPFRTLSRAYPVESLSEALAEGILVGHSDMPEFQLEPAEIDAILAYIQSVQEPRAS